jgi:NitT/TauT family transport system substrate-binding protein
MNDGKLRIIARGSDVPSLKGQTVRTLIVNKNAWQTKHDAIVRFMDAYREAVDWMYSDPKAVEMYSAKIHKPVALLKQSMQDFHPKSSLQTTEFKDLAGAVRDAVKLKYLDKPLTDAQLKEMIVTPPAKK